MNRRLLEVGPSAKLLISRTTSNVSGNQIFNLLITCLDRVEVKSE